MNALYALGAVAVLFLIVYLGVAGAGLAVPIVHLAPAAPRRVHSTGLHGGRLLWTLHRYAEAGVPARRIYLPQ